MWIHFTVEMEVEAIFEDQLYREAIENYRLPLPYPATYQYSD